MMDRDAAMNPDLTDAPANLAHIDISLTDSAFFGGDDVHAAFRTLRAEDPVHWTVGKTLSRGFWSVTTQADIRHVLGDAAVFSSQVGGTVLPSTREFETPTEEQRKRYGIEIVNTDPPRHQQMRSLMNPHFLPKIIRSYEEAIEGLINTLLDDLVARGDVDIVQDFAKRIPHQMICQFMGVPREDWESMRIWADMAVAHDDAAYQVGSAFETKKQGFENLVEYCRKLALSRREAPLDDLTSAMAVGAIDGVPLSELELGWNTMIFVVGGLETARNAIAGGLLALDQHPEQMKLLMNDPALLKPAVEEILRWTSPAMHVRRTATQDVEVGGRAMKAGDWVVCWLPSGNRDEAVFADPFRFDITRTPNRHVAFGGGVHHCIGRDLARLELTLTLKAIVERKLQITMTAEPVRVQTNMVSGFKRMPARVTAG
jgi:cytochrome P450